jgi:hypothetical protein
MVLMRCASSSTGINDMYMFSLTPHAVQAVGLAKLCFEICCRETVRVNREVCSGTAKIWHGCPKMQDFIAVSKHAAGARGACQFLQLLSTAGPDHNGALWAALVDPCTCGKHLTAVLTASVSTSPSEVEKLARWGQQRQAGSTSDTHSSCSHRGQRKARNLS